jgi:hypothetical protein
MSKFAKDIKVNDIIWTISEGDKPQLLPMIVVDIKIKKYPWTGYYNLTVKLPDGSDKYLSLFDTGERRDYDIPLLTDLLSTLDYSNYEELIKSEITIMVCFDKDALWNHYVNGLEKSIKYVEEIIERGKKNLIELNEKLNYIKKQYDNIQGG